MSITKITYVYYHSSVGLTVILMLKKNINKTQVIVDHLKLQVQSYLLSAQVRFLHSCTCVLHTGQQFSLCHNLPTAVQTLLQLLC